MVAGSLLAYTAIGFGLLPYVIQHQAPKWGLSALERRVSMESVRFNPFTLRLEVQGFKVAEVDDAPLLSWNMLVIDLEWASLIRRTWTLAEIRLTAPTVHLAIAPDGKFNVSELLATLERQFPSDKSEGGMPRLVVNRFVLEQGKVDVSDQQAGYANTISPLNFELNSFSTLPDQTGNYRVSAASLLGGKLSWTGSVSVNPMQARGEVTLEDAALSELATYLKPYTTAHLQSGRLSATVPYRFAYEGGRFEAELAGARLRLNEVTLAAGEGREPIALLNQVTGEGIQANLATRVVSIGALRVEGGAVTVTRQANGALDWAQLSVPVDSQQVVSVGVAPPLTWALQVQALALDQVAIRAMDQTVSPALTLGIDKVKLNLSLNAEQTGQALNLITDEGDLTLDQLTLASGSQTPLTINQLGFSDGRMNLAERKIKVERLVAEGGQLQLQRDATGQLNLMTMLPQPQPSDSTLPAQTSNSDESPAWQVLATQVQLNQWGAAIADQTTGIAVNLQNVALQLEGASNQLSQPVQFKASLAVREGGQLSAQGRVVPATGAVDAKVQVQQLALAPWQPLLSQSVKLVIAGGHVSAQGQLTTGAARDNRPALRYTGGLAVADLALHEAGGVPFAAWKRVEAAKLGLQLSPNRLDIPDLLVLEPNATLIIEDDRSLNAARLLVKPVAATDSPAAVPVTGQPETDSFPVRIQRLRLKNAKVDFADLSLRPQFGAKVVELNGVVTGLSSNRQARSQIELDGRVDEFGLARVRGELNPFAPQDNTDVNVVFKNVSIVSASPYSMKFAGYKVAQGKVSLDLQYKIRQGQMVGANQIVLDQLTLGDKVDSPDALSLPLELAIALLKDNDGRIELGLPVSGDMRDPQFSYGAVVWKAIGNVLTKIVTAPFRALGSLLGLSGEKMEAIEFDPASSTLLPPEQENVKNLAQMLGQRAQLQLTVPSAYSTAADHAALKSQALRAEVARRVGRALSADDAPGPLDLGDAAVQKVMRDLYAERLGEAALDQQKKEAEATETTASSTVSKAKLPLDQGVLKRLKGEPLVVDASAFYRRLQSGLEQSQALVADALPQLGAQRAAVVLAALERAGVARAQVKTTPPEAVDSAVDQPVRLTLGLGAK